MILRYDHMEEEAMMLTRIVDGLTPVMKKNRIQTEKATQNVYLDNNKERRTLFLTFSFLIT